MLFDPTSNLIKAYNMQKEIKEKDDKTKGKKNKRKDKENKDEDNVDQLAERQEENNDPITHTSSKDAKRISEKARNIASILHVVSSHQQALNDIDPRHKAAKTMKSKKKGKRHYSYRQKSRIQTLIVYQKLE